MKNASPAKIGTFHPLLTPSALYSTTDFWPHMLSSVVLRNTECNLGTSKKAALCCLFFVQFFFIGC